MKNENSDITVKINLEAEETIKKLETIKQLLIDISEKIIETGIDLGQEKDYTTVATYAGGELIKEETIQYK